MKVRDESKGRRSAREVPAAVMKELSAYNPDEFREFLQGEARALLVA